MKELKRIKPPKFKVGKYSLNEYELRQLQLDVAKGLQPSGIVVKDCNNNRAVINDDGSLTDDLTGMDWSIKIKLELLSVRNSKA
jgi:hypothetical protein